MSRNSQRPFLQKLSFTVILSMIVFSDIQPYSSPFAIFHVSASSSPILSNLCRKVSPETQIYSIVLIVSIKRIGGSLIRPTSPQSVFKPPTSTLNLIVVSILVHLGSSSIPFANYETAPALGCHPSLLFQYPLAFSLRMISRLLFLDILLHPLLQVTSRCLVFLGKAVHPSDLVVLR